MVLPLYKLDEKPTLGPNGNRGLWWERFFNRYNDDWTIPEDGKLNWVNENAKLTGSSDYIRSYALRRLALLRALGGYGAVFKTDWHFATGLGLPHPLENGLAWHPTLGTPYLAGSGVKGLVKAWVEVWDENLNAEQREDRSSKWFGLQEQAGGLLFFDAIPIAPTLLAADVITPHMGKWYEQGGQIDDYHAEPDKVPADWHDPVPTPLLVAQQAQLLFGVAPRRPEFASEVKPALDALQQALIWLGAGAKTAAGYGRMERDAAALDSLCKELDAIQAKARNEAEQRKRLNELSPLERSIEEWLDAKPAGQRRHVALIKGLQQGRWQGDAIVQVAQRIQKIMIEDKAWRPKSEKKNPAKDKDYQHTLIVLKYLEDKLPS